MTRLVLSLLCLLASVRAAAIDLTGRIGATYVRLDEYAPPPTSTHSTEPTLDLDLGLDARGFVYRPDALYWNLGFSYRRISEELNGRRTRLRDLIFYDGSATLFSGRASPLSVTLDASRAHANFSQSSAVNVTGESITTTAGGTLSLHAADLPSVTAGYHRVQVDSDTPSLGHTWRNSDRLNGKLVTGTASFNLDAVYQGELSDGSFQLDRTDRHLLNVSVNTPITKSFQVIASDIYQAVKPHRMELGAVDLEANAFRLVGTNSGDTGNRQLVTYSYVHSLQQAFQLPMIEAARQGLRYEGDLFLTDPNLFTHWTVDTSLLQARNGPVEVKTTGETAGVQLWWRRPSEAKTYEVFGGPLIGFIQSDALGDSNGWGLMAGARARFPWAGQNVNVSYNGDYQSDLYGNPGWSLRQSAAVALGGPLGGGRYDLQLGGGGFRTHSPLFKGTLGRTLDLTARATSRDWSVEVRGTLQDRIAGSSSQEIVGDGLFIPAPFDSSTRQVALRVGRSLLPGLSAAGQFRYLNTVYPGMPSLNELEGLASLQYSYAALTFALEDRLQRYQQATSTGNVWGTTNQVMLRVYRAIGWSNR